MTNELVKYDAMCRAIDAAYAVDEVMAIHDRAAMLQAAARVANNTDAEMQAYQIRAIMLDLTNWTCHIGSC